MFKRSKISYAIAAAAALSAAGTGTASAQIEEIVVTATKRSASAQDVPVTIQAIGESAIEDLGIDSFEDYIRNLAGVVAGGRGPGRNEIFIRGVSAGKGGFKISGAIGTEPNVALYLDEAPITLAGRNIDPYMTDMQRVEVLPGPQGTIFGASSQAGTVRLITNKPQHNEFDAGFDLMYGTIKGGGTDNAVEGFVNIPLIDDKLSARVAMFNAKNGGYIDNVEASRQIALTNPTLAAFGIVSETRETSFNGEFARDDFNEATYAGFRASLKYSPNEDWEVLLSQFNQELSREGVWDYTPELGDFNTANFTPDYSDDEFEMTSWTVSGRVANLDMVYTGSYLDRVVDEVADYSGYADNGPFIPYYICSYPGYASCGSSALFLEQAYEVERTTHELRFATSEENRWQAIFGAFYDDVVTVERGDWNYPATIGLGFAPNAPIPTATNSNPNTRRPGVAFFNDFTRTKEEFSLFGELSYDITDKLTASIGLRNYDIDLDLSGSSNFANRGIDGNFGRDVDTILGEASPTNFSDTIGKFNLQYQVSDDVMVYGTISEGFRAGGFNRNGGASQVPGVGPFVPDFFESDELLNTEIGWKTDLMDGALRFNGAAYFIEWDNIQIQTLDFTVSNLAFISNAVDAEIKGLEIDSIYQPNENFTFFANVSYNDSEITRVPPNIVSIAPVGSTLALAPELQYVLRGRYDWDTANGRAFGQVSYQYTDDAISSVNVGALFEQPSYTTIDATLGYARDNWSATLFVENLTDELAVLFVSNEDDIIKNTPNRPRTIGVRFSYDFD